MAAVPSFTIARRRFAILGATLLSDLEVAISKAGGEVNVDHLPIIQADPVQMRQLFQNLLSNAMKFRKEGENPVVTIRCAVQGAECRVEVEDNGIGLEEEFAEKIFAP